MPKLADLAQIRVGFTYRGSLKRATRGALAVVQMKDVNPHSLANLGNLARVTIPTLAQRYLLQQGDLIFRARGLANEAFVFDSTAPAICIAPLLFIRIHDQQQLHPHFLQWQINLPSTQARIADSARGIAIKMISISALATLDITVPDFERQQHILGVDQLLGQSLILQRDLLEKRQQFVQKALLQFAMR
jgi:restriction endonuclease S subunit